MAEKKIICGIDVGTTKIVAVIAEYTDKDFSIVGIGESRSDGLQRGVIVNIKETIKSLSSAIKKAESQCGYSVKSVFVGISGDHIMGMDGAGVVSVGNAGAGAIGDVIDKDDKDRVLKSAQAMSLSSERRILHVLSQNFKVDERSGIEEPEGLTGSRLAANVHLVTSSRKTENDFKTCFDDLSIDISDFVLEPLASSYSILSKDEKKLGAIMIDIGGGTTDIVVWEDGGIKDTIIIPLGGEIITQDIARTIGCPMNVAEDLKIKYGSAIEDLAIEEKIVVKSSEGNIQEVESKMLSSIVEARVQEILSVAKFKIEHKTKIENLSFGIILTGGGAELRSITEFSENIFPSKIRIGKPMKNIESVEAHIFRPKYSTAIGIIKYAVDHKEDLGITGVGRKRGFLRDFITNLKELWNN